MKSTVCLCVLLLCLQQSSATPRRSHKKYDLTALDEYVAKEDLSYKWARISSYPDTGVGYSTHIINMTSQTWKTEAETNQPEWYHYLIIVIPTTIKYLDTAFIMVDNGDMDDAVPTPQNDGRVNGTAEFALGMKAISVDIKMIPNQELHCAGDPADRWRREDDLIAWTWRRYINENGADPEILLQLPMTKAAVRAMDAVTEFIKSIYPAIQLNSFIMSGGSKRGWTTYLAAAVDTRVIAMIPEVLSCLNFTAVMRHQYRAYGGWSFAQEDYYNENITQEVENPVLQQMMDIIDPFTYMDRYTIPKLIISASGDEHFMPDDSWYYWDAFVGPKYIWMLEDSGHDTGDSPHGDDIVPNMIAFFRAVKNNERLPVMSWTKAENTTHGSITVTTDMIPNAISMVYGDTLSSQRRDIRMHIGIPDPSNPVPQDIVWTEENVLIIRPGQYKAEYKLPETGWRCFFIKMTYISSEGLPLYVTSETHIIPNIFPYQDCVGAAGCWGTLL